MFKDCEFVLLTRGRTDDQYTLSTFPSPILKMITICCHQGEKEAHIKNWGGKVKDIVEYQGSFVGEARDWVVNHFDKKFIFFIEDNVILQTRVHKPDFGGDCEYGLHAMTETKFTDKTKENIIMEIFLSILEKLETREYGMVGLSQRTGNNRVTERFVENTRLYGFWAVDKENYLKIGAKYSDTVYREDFLIELFFLTNGYKTGVFYDFAFGKKSGVGTKGGCSEYRTQLATDANAEFLANLFPEFVRVAVKEKKSWEGYTGEIKDVVIYWKKAYEYGKRNKRD